MIRYEKFQKALKHLESQYYHYNRLEDDQPEYIHEALKESVIQRFEICWDCLWKVLRRHLEETIGLVDLPNGPKPILRLANENGLLPSGIEKWLEYNDSRIATSHDYSGVKAETALELMNDFIADAIELYQTMSRCTWDT